MIEWPAKEESEVRPYGLNWTARIAPATIVTSSLIVVEGNISIDSQAFNATTVTCIISGGTNGCPAILINTITTSDGDTWEEEITLLIMSSACIVSAPSTASKRTIIQMAYEKAGQPGYEFEATPEEVASAVRSLDALMSQWTIQGISINYNFPAVLGTSDPDEESGIPDWAVLAAVNALSYEEAPGMGKTMTPEARGSLARGLTALRAATLNVPQMRLPRGTPSGAGNKPWSTWQPYIVEAVACAPCSSCP